MKNNILSLFAGLGIWAGLLTSPAVLYAQEDMSAYDIDIDVTYDDVVGYSSFSSSRFNFYEFHGEDHPFADTTGYVSGDLYMCVSGRSSRMLPSISVGLLGRNVWQGKYDVYVVMVPHYYQSGEVPAEGDVIQKSKIQLAVEYLEAVTDTRTTSVESDVIDYDGTKVDTILAMEDFVFPMTYYKGYSGLYVDDRKRYAAFPIITLSSARLTTAEKKDGYVNQMCIDRIILKAKDVTPGGQTVLTGDMDGNMSYSLDTQTGTLTFSGSGNVNAFPEIDGYVKSAIHSVVVEEGITGFYPGTLSSNIVSVSLPSTLKDFGNTFQGSSVPSLTVPASVTYIADNAFKGSQLSSITFSGNVLKIIGDGAFRNTPLSEIELPNSVESIGDNAFANTNIRNIVIPEGTKSIGRLAFCCAERSDNPDTQYDDEQLESISLPSSLKSIGDSAFCNSALTEFTMPSGIKSLGEDLFANTPLHKVWWDVSSAIDMGEISADGDPFRSVRAQIDTFYIAENAEQLPDRLCKGMTISEIVIPGNVQSIGARCFEDCSIGSLLYIPASVKSIGERAFVGEYDVDDANGALCDVDGILFSKDKTKLLCYPHHRIDRYSIPDGVRELSTWAFGEMFRVDIPASVRVLGFDAFASTQRITTQWKTAEELPELLPSYYYANDGRRVVVQVPQGSMDVYKQAEGWKECGIVYDFDANLIGNALLNNPSFSVFAKMMEATEWNKELLRSEDEEYYRLYKLGMISPESCVTWFNTANPPERRYYGYTVFAEKNTVFEALLGKSAEAISLRDLTTYLAKHYEGKTDEDYTSEDHVLNRFVSYHLLPMKLHKSKLVIHFNEIGYDRNGRILSRIPVMEYYETMGKGRRLMKISESAISNGVRINRFVRTDRETGYEIPSSGVEGLAIDTGDGEYDLFSNGYLYALDDLLVYSQDVCNSLGSERMRYDVATLLPELSSNDIRCNENLTPVHQAKVFPNNYPYIENMTASKQTSVVYLTGRFGENVYWNNYQGDEFNFIGQYDVTVKLPPVPEDGTYELRLGFYSNSLNGMGQIYVGTDKDNLQPCGLPVDFRTGTYSAFLYYTIGWWEDIDDEIIDQLDDLRLREGGYMKGIASTHGTDATKSLRAERNCLRKIIGQFHMEAGETYYMRVKSCLPDTDQQLSVDFIELVPEKVYNNPAESEDKW